MALKFVIPSRAKRGVGNLLALMTSALLGATVASAQGGGAVVARPAVRLGVGILKATYGDRSKSEAIERVDHSGEIAMSGTDVVLDGNYKNWEGELGVRSLTPDGTPWWSKRNETRLTGAYYWAKFRWVQPAVGYLMVSQAGDRSDDDAPPAFIDRNTALSFGLRSLVNVWSFGKHGIIGEGRFDTLTSLESGRNFGDEGYLGIGYFFATGRFRGALVAGQLRNFFNAEVPDPDDSDVTLAVRHTYVANRFGVYFEY
jgi:hypothetical protein